MVSRLEKCQAYRIFINGREEPTGGVYIGTVRTPVGKSGHQVAVKEQGHSRSFRIWNFGGFTLEGDNLKIPNAYPTRLLNEREIERYIPELGRRRA